MVFVRDIRAYVWPRCSEILTFSHAKGDSGKAALEKALPDKTESSCTEAHRTGTDNLCIVGNLTV